MNKIKYIISCLVVLLSCSKTDDETEQTLDIYIQNKVFETGAVIACAASNKDTNEILAFYYPEPGASDIRLYETVNVQLDKSDFENYTRNSLTSDPFFNGHLGVFTQNSLVEKWIIITFELDGEIKISNPILTKQLSKPTVWNDEVTINQTISGMPNFTWQNNQVGDNAIYFQVVSDGENNLLSGTYTFENNFQYYNIDNVVLNVTTSLPPNLVLNRKYNFTLMDVSLDNWVNLVIQKSFIAE